MLFLKRALSTWYQIRAYKLDCSKYSIFVEALLEYAKKNGFKCQHRPLILKGEEIRIITQDMVRGDYMLECKECGERYKP